MTGLGEVEVVLADVVVPQAKVVHGVIVHSGYDQEKEAADGEQNESKNVERSENGVVSVSHVLMAIFSAFLVHEPRDVQRQVEG